MRNRKLATLSAFLIAFSFVAALGGSHRTKFEGEQRLSLPAQSILDENAEPLIASNGKVGFISSVTSGSLISFSISSGKVFSSISVGENAGPLSMIETGGLRLLSVPAANHPGDGNPAAVSIVDATSPKSMELKSLLVLPPDAMITPATRAMLSADGRYCFVASSFDEPTLFSFDVESGQVVAKLPLSGRPSDVALYDKGGRRIVAVASAASNSILFVRAGKDGSLSSSATFSADGARIDDSNNLAFSSDGRMVFIGSAGSNLLHAIDDATGVEIANVSVASPQRVTVARKGNADAIAVTRVESGAEGRGGVDVLVNDGQRFNALSHFDPPQGVGFSRANNAVFTADGATVFVGSTTGVLFAFSADTGELDSYNVVGSELRRVGLSEKAKAVAAVRSAPSGDQVVVVHFDLTDDGSEPPAPIIDSLVPNVVEQGRLRNLKLVVLGRNFTDGASLIVNGAEIAADLVRKGKALESKLPKSAFDQAGSISVVVKAANGVQSEPAVITVIPPNTPVLDSIDPVEVAGPAEPFFLVVKGSNFRSSSTIFAGDRPLDTEHVNDAKLRALIPSDIAGVVGTLKVSVRDLAVTGLTSSDKDLLIYGPRIKELRTSVDEVVAGDKRFVLRIIGENFREGAQVDLSLNGQGLAAGSAEVKGRKLIRLTVGSGLFQDAGVMTVVVRNPVFGGASDPAELTIHGPQITSFAPDKVLAGLTDVQVDIQGVDFRRQARVYVGNDTGAFAIPRSLVRFRNTGRIVVTLTDELNSLLAAPGTLKFTVVNRNASDGVPSDSMSLSVVGPAISSASAIPRDDAYSRIVIEGENFRTGAIVEFLVGDMVVRQQEPSKLSESRLSLLVRNKKLAGMGDYQLRVVNPGNIPSEPFHPQGSVAAAGRDD